MNKLVLASCLALGLGLFATGGASPAHAANDDNQNGSSGCGDTVFCGWWYWIQPGPSGGVGGAGTCYAGDRNCLPPGSINPGQPGGDCWDDPTSDACEGNTWSTGASSSSQGVNRPGNSRGRTGRR